MKTILVVEDDSDIAETLGELLGDAGYATVVKTDSEEALVWLKDSPAPSLILLDLMMPKMDGRELRGAIARLPHLSAVPVVVVTADARVRETQEDLGAAAHLTKPVDLDDLLKTIARFTR